MIETERLTLREHRIEDFSSYIPLWVERPPSPDGGFRLPPLKEEDVWYRLLRWIGHRYAFGFAPFLVFDRVSGCLCGEVGFGHFHRDNGPDFDSVPEAMWIIAEEHHGKGIAGEVMAAACAWFDRQKISARTVCMIDPLNTVSQKLAGRLGFREFERASYKGREAIFYERLQG